MWKLLQQKLKKHVKKKIAYNKMNDFVKLNFKTETIYK